MSHCRYPLLYDVTAYAGVFTEPLFRTRLHNAVVPLLLGADDIENTASSIVACWTVFTELLPGNALIKSVRLRLPMAGRRTALWRRLRAAAESLEVFLPLCTSPTVLDTYISRTTASHRSGTTISWPHNNQESPENPGRDTKWIVLVFKATVLLIYEHFMK
jgi:hypothetical protein